ncbi:MAG: L-iditol 2-dehydrogenase [Pseudonocardiales bacterium]|nr:L-iditol 2-dehydrogenase [Pseudonocardiales bacterium]
MKALVKWGLGDGELEVRDIPEPEPVRGRVLVEVHAAGVCGSDVHMWRNHQSWEVKLPVVLGHEMAGVVVDAEEATGFHVGERVVCETAAHVCGRCQYCHSGNYNLCPHRQGYGALADGAFTRYLSVNPQIVHRIPDSVPDHHAALAEPLCVALNGLVERARISPGDVVLVQGAGPIGIMALQVAKASGAGAVIVCGTDADSTRLEVARALGADVVLNVAREDPLAVLRDMGEGWGADVVVDATGVSASLQQAMEFVRPMGQIAKIGWGPQPLGFSLDPLVAKAITLLGSFSHNFRTWERSLALLATGQVDLDPVIGGVYDVTQWPEAFDAMQAGRNVKSVLTGF